MKKLLTLTAVALTFGLMSASVFADSHQDKGGKFAKHDTNGDGVISKSEFLAHSKERFSKMDADGNGEISKEESKAARKAMHEKMKEKGQKRKEKQDAAE